MTEFHPPCNECGRPVTDWKPLAERAKVVGGRVVSVSITPVCKRCRKRRRP